MRLLSLLVASLVAMVLLVALAPWPTQAAVGPAMKLTVAGGDVTCQSADACRVPVATSFSLLVEVVAPPDDGYVGFQSEVYYAQGLTYNAAPAADEVVWPPGALPLRGESPRLIAHADVTATQPPLLATAHTGPAVELAMFCPPIAGFFVVALLPFQAAGRPAGAGFVAPDGSGAAGATIAAKTSSSQPIDVDGDGLAETVPVSAAIQIHCAHEQPTPTPTPAPLPGDASCNGVLDAIDAALILQAVAGLIATLPCPENGDRSGDGALTSVDAALVLQIVAGLIDP